MPVPIVHPAHRRGEKNTNNSRPECCLRESGEGFQPVLATYSFGLCDCWMRGQERDLLRRNDLCRIGVAIALLVTGGAVALAQATAAPSGPEIWDANHDGVYTCAEWKSFLDRIFTSADRNRDGNLDPSEFALVRKAGRRWRTRTSVILTKTRTARSAATNSPESRVRSSCDTTTTAIVASPRTK
jgi:hypothetical protein